MSSLVRYDAMCRAIAAANSLGDVLALRDEAVAWAAAAKNRRAETRARVVRARAEIKAGKLEKAATSQG